MQFERSICRWHFKHWTIWQTLFPTGLWQMVLFGSERSTWIWSSGPASQGQSSGNACREQLSVGSRAVGSDPRSAVPQSLYDGIARSRGEAVLLAARPGSYAFDDHQVKACATQEVDAVLQYSTRRKVLSAHPEAEIRFPLKPEWLRPDARLRFGVTLKPDSWGKPGADGVRFEVLLETKGQSTTLFDVPS